MNNLVTLYYSFSDQCWWRLAIEASDGSYTYITVEVPQNTAEAWEAEIERAMTRVTRGESPARVILTRD